MYELDPNGDVEACLRLDTRILALLETAGGDLGRARLRPVAVIDSSVLGTAAGVPACALFVSQRFVFSPKTSNTEKSHAEIPILGKNDSAVTSSVVSNPSGLRMHMYKSRFWRTGMLLTCANMSVLKRWCTAKEVTRSGTMF